jgi:hypothetical protein
VRSIKGTRVRVCNIFAPISVRVTNFLISLWIIQPCGPDIRNEERFMCKVNPYVNPFRSSGHVTQHEVQRLRPVFVNFHTDFAPEMKLQMRILLDLEGSFFSVNRSPIAKHNHHETEYFYITMRSLHFSVDLILPAALSPGVDSASNRNIPGGFGAADT